MLFHNNAPRILRSLSNGIRRQTSAVTITNARSFQTFALHHTSTSAVSNNIQHPTQTQSLNIQQCRELSTAKLIQKLRKTTGAPMVECKKAISDPEVDGDFEKATEWLRKHGSAKMSTKLAGRDASEGLVGIGSSSSSSSSSGNDAISIVRVSSETDFASRSPDFSNLVETVANATLEMNGNGNDVNLDELKESSNVKQALEDAIISIRENLQIASATTIQASRPNSVLTGYVHGKIFNDKSAGTAAAIVELAPMNDDNNNMKSKEEMMEIGKKLAMHIVAARPTYLNIDNIPTDIITKEKNYLLEQMSMEPQNAKKPKEILEKIVNGRLGKFYQGVCLVEQSHMLEDGNPKVGKALKDYGLEVVAYESVSI